MCNYFFRNCRNLQKRVHRALFCGPIYFRVYVYIFLIGKYDLKKTLNKNLQWIWIQKLLFKRPMPYPLSFDYYIIFMKLFTKLKSYYINDSYGDMNHIFTTDGRSNSINAFLTSPTRKNGGCNQCPCHAWGCFGDCFKKVCCSNICWQVHSCVYRITI